MVHTDNKEEIKKFYESEMCNNPVFRQVMERLAKL
jgi:hypothetical protein